VHEGLRYVQVGETVFHAKEVHWRTFTSFLRNYITAALDRSWYQIELAKSSPDRHPLMRWFDRALAHDTAAQEQEKDALGFVPATGAIMAIVHLSYDLYCLAHNIELRAKLIERLKAPEQFQGARYEIFVAACLIRAGYQVEFEDEDDRRRTHCEFNALAPSGKRYSVEAKHRHHEGGAKPRLKLGKLLSKALKKHAAHSRIVFIETSLPDAGSSTKDINFYRNAIRTVRRLHTKCHQGKSAYLVVTNTPFEHHLDATDFETVICVDGFGIPDFGFDVKFGSFRTAYLAQEVHRDIYDLAAALNRDRDVPVTFDGDIPELAYGDQRRLTIGSRYLVPDASGNEVSALLVDAIVIPEERNALCINQMADGQYYMHTVPLSDMELAAHKAHPDTFFGVIRTPRKLASTSMQLFEFFYDTYRRNTKEQLLKLFSQSGASLEGLADLDRDELALRYAEACTISAARSNYSSDRSRQE